MISGRATTQGTARYFTRFRAREGASQAGLTPRLLGSTALNVSPVGFGGYRASANDPTHHEALRLALLSGCNLIDTSTNYQDGASEELVGDALEELILEKRIARDEIVVVTKAGYVQGQNMTLARDRNSKGRPFPEMVEYDAGVWHCISPEFLEDQITRSLNRLQLETVDVLLLHNPEYFLKAKGDHREYYQRIHRAFEYLETEVSRGRIGSYGISSNTFPSQREAPDYTSLEAVWDIAQEMSQVMKKDHHFRVIQFPFNLFEPDAALEQNNSGKSVLEFAREKNLGTLANRPLNAFTEKGLFRLADFPAHDDKDIAESLKSVWTRAMELESEYPSLSKEPPVQARDVAWGHIIKHNFDKISELDSWKGILKYQIEPTLESVLPKLEAVAVYRDWALAYRSVSAKLFTSFQEFLENQASYRSDVLSSKIDHACPELHVSETLSQKVIRLYLSVPGLHTVLVGMREPDYVRDSLEIREPVSAEKALQTLRTISLD